MPTPCVLYYADPSYHMLDIHVTRLFLGGKVNLMGSIAASTALVIGAGARAGRPETACA